MARFGLVARSVFYCILVYLVARLAGARQDGKQANAHGALSTIAAHPGGLAAIAATSAGFFAFGAIRVWGGIRDVRSGRWRRVMTLLQGAFYLVLTWVPLSYVLGKRSEGSEQQQHRTATGILRLPAGREILFALGLVVVGVCANQMWTGAHQDYADGLRIERSPRWVRLLTRAAGTVGIPARAAVFLPIGVFCMIAAAQSNSRHADGVDEELVALTRHAWGEALLALVALGLAVFAVYSFLEARYRALTRAA